MSEPEQGTCFPVHLDEKSRHLNENLRGVVALTASLAVPRLRIAGEGKGCDLPRSLFSY
jgi:hypothetical protein